MSSPLPKNSLTQKDGVVAVLLVLMLTLLVSGLAGAHWVFAYALVVWLGALAGIGLVKAGQPTTWLAAMLVFAWLACGMTGVLMNESVVVNSVADTVLGFQPGTASLIYGIWVPGVFTLAIAFILLFDRSVDAGQRTS